MKGSRLRAKGEKIEFDTEDGKEEYTLYPIKNKQLLEVTELADKKEGIKAAIKNNRVHWHEVIVDGYLANGKNVTTKTQKNKKKPRR